MQVELKRIQQEVGITFIYVTHDQEEAMTMSDRIAVMNQGTLRAARRPRGAVRAPATRFVAGFLGDQQPAAGAIATAGQRLRRSELADGTPVRAPRGRSTAARPSMSGVRPEKIRLREPADGESADWAQPPARHDRRRVVPGRQHPVPGRGLADGARLTVYEQNVERATRPSSGRPARRSS